MDFPLSGSGRTSRPERPEQAASLSGSSSSSAIALAEEDAINRSDAVRHYDASLELVRKLVRDEVPVSEQEQTIAALRAAINHPTTSASQEAAGRTVSNLGYLLQTGELPLVHQPEVAADLIKKSVPALSNLSPEWQAGAAERLGMTLYHNQARNLGVRTKLHMVRAIYARANQHWANDWQQRNTLKAPAVSTWCSNPAHEPEVREKIAEYALGYLQRGEAEPESIARGALMNSWSAALRQRGVPEHLRQPMGRVLMRSLEPFRANDPDYSEAVCHLADTAARVPEAQIPLEFFANYVDHPGIIATPVVDAPHAIRQHLSDALIGRPTPVRDFSEGKLTFPAFLEQCEHEPWNIDVLLHQSPGSSISALVRQARSMIGLEEGLVQRLMDNGPRSDEVCRVQNRQLNPRRLLERLQENHEMRMQTVREHTDIIRRYRGFIEKSEQYLREQAPQP